jgi:chromosome segregation ATPase
VFIRENNSGSKMRCYHFKKVWPIILLILSAIIFFPSCVTKKKYIVLEESRNRAENRVKELTIEVDKLKKDFEEFRVISMENLTSKQNFADSLNRIVSSLNTDISSKDDNIEDQIFSFQLEKGKLNQEISDKDKEIRNLTRELNTLKVQIDDLTKKVEDATSNRKFPFGQVKQLERKLQTRDTEISELNLKLGNALAENDSLQSKINKISLDIEMLKAGENLQKLDSIGTE